MEDAATAEISRAQIWQWLQHRSKTNNGILIDKKYIENILNQELQKIKEKIGKELFEKGNYDKASNIFINLCVSEKFEDFLTIPSYEYL